MLIGSALGGGVSDKEQINDAVKAYKKGDFTTAKTSLQTVKNPTPATWFNLGHCYYALGDRTNAIVCWLRADRNATIAERREHEHNRIRAGDLPDYKESRWQRAAVWLVFGIPPLLLQILVIFACITLCWVCVIYLPRRWRIMWIFLSILLIVTCGSILFMRWYSDQPYGLVIQQASLHCGPDDRYATIANIAPLQRVNVLSRHNDWMHVQYKDGCIGWVKQDILEIV